VTLHTAKK